MDDKAEALDVLEFWWRAGPAKWFARSDEFDALCRERLGKLHARAAAGELDHWAAAPHSMLALIILLDQVSRNIHRNTPQAFAQDAKALSLAEQAVEKGFDRAYPLPARAFFYMPFEHAEDMAAQERAVDLFRAAGDREFDYYALLHLDIIRRFGRFPHRNPILGRETTEAERRYLETGGFAG
jgi:uncharacterized protein (DUF924 family)